MKTACDLCVCLKDPIYVWKEWGVGSCITSWLWLAADDGEGKRVHSVLAVASFHSSPTPSTVINLLGLALYINGENFLLLFVLLLLFFYFFAIENTLSHKSALEK